MNGLRFLTKRAAVKTEWNRALSVLWGLVRLPGARGILLARGRSTEKNDLFA